MSYSDYLLTELDEEDVEASEQALESGNEGEDRDTTEDVEKNTRPVFEDPLSLLDLEANLDEFVKTKRISDVVDS